MWLILLHAAIAVVVIVDASRRMIPSPALWALAAFLLGPIALPMYLARRPLLERERRRGGIVWNLSKYFVLYWTINAAVIFSWSTWSHSKTDAVMSALTQVAETTFNTIPLPVWPVLLAFTLLLGLLFRRKSIVEIGPTGPLAWWIKPIKSA